jgi:hypothetical protein
LADYVRHEFFISHGDIQLNTNCIFREDHIADQKPILDIRFLIDVNVVLQQLANAISTGAELWQVQARAVSLARDAGDLETAALACFHNDRAKTAEASFFKLAMLKLSADLHGKITPTAALPKISAAVDTVLALTSSK